MRKLFIQFYTLIISCFLIIVLLVSITYKDTLDHIVGHSLDEVLLSSVDAITDKLHNSSPQQWPTILAEEQVDFPYHLQIKLVDDFDLTDEQINYLIDNKAVMLMDKHALIQLIPGSREKVLMIGPISYLYYLHELRMMDLILMLIIGFSLLLPIISWMRPHLRDLIRLEQSVKNRGQSNLSEHLDLPAKSSVRYLASAFNQMSDNISNLNESKKRLIDGIAHELRTPLTRLRYRLTLCDGLSETEQRALNRNIEQLDSLIDELIIYARLDRPQIQLNLEPLSMSNWLQEKLDDIRLFYPDKNIEMMVNLKNDIKIIDKQLLDHVLDNLLNNGLRYTRETMKVSLYDRGLKTFLRVEDDGPGIPPDQRQRIFEPFIRLNPRKDGVSKGCGLGLAMVSSIAKSLKGSVVVGESPYLGGACFYFSWFTIKPHLPAAENSPSP
ncbi:MAG: two-component system sensor histidine kinase RstB [Enterobacteriaceae bacterium]